MIDVLHLLTVACLFAAAWLISRVAAYVARKVLAWHEGHHQGQAHLTLNLYKAAHGIK